MLQTSLWKDGAEDEDDPLKTIAGLGAMSY